MPTPYRTARNYPSIGSISPPSSAALFSRGRYVDIQGQPLQVLWAHKRRAAKSGVPLTSADLTLPDGFSRTYIPCAGADRLKTGEIKLSGPSLI